MAGLTSVAGLCMPYQPYARTASWTTAEWCPRAPCRHSLGGALAMLCAFDCKNRSPCAAENLDVKCEAARSGSRRHCYKVYENAAPAWLSMQLYQPRLQMWSGRHSALPMPAIRLVPYPSVSTGYTFGAPRPGNRAFAQLYNRTIPDTW